ncbi:MAG: alpha-ketoglutarate-dependent dioxygenase AlkB [Bacteroidetes bacterium]|jgi:alkylated DNA repair dioxygenase AlkB|nr:alpha-ketoglutarate-dependent dioxygenase AlkB [Bacteroidota bacterium]
MDLFSDSFEPANILPFDGTVIYYGKVMDEQEARYYFHVLPESIEWKNDEAVIMGKLISTARKVAWYGDENFSYTYSGVTKTALPWTKELLELKLLAEKITGATFNSCLLNLYHTGEEGMAWHSDGEKMLEKNGTIVSMSFGAERKFSFKHKSTKETVSLVLERGSILAMKDETQTYWLHRLPPTTKVKDARISLTFRTIVK